jgi:hypothetical protein
LKSFFEASLLTLWSKLIGTGKIPDLLIQLINFAVLSVSIFLLCFIIFQKTRIGKAFFRFKEHFIERIVNKAIPISQVIRAAYGGEERNQEHFKKEISKHLLNSKRIHLLLISGHTMFYDEREKFIRDILKDISIKGCEKRDIRIKLLDRSTEEFQKRAQWFSQYLFKIDAINKCSYEEYVNRCQKNEIELKVFFPGCELRFYESMPLWRIHLFDDAIFLSLYQEGIPGHLTQILQFFSGNIIYEGFSKYFNML